MYMNFDFYKKIIHKIARIFSYIHMIWEIDHLEKSLVKKFPEEFGGF